MTLNRSSIGLTCLLLSSCVIHNDKALPTPVRIAAPARNLVANPGFESGALAPWASKSARPLVGRQGPHAGGFALRVEPGDEVAQTIAGLEPSGFYVLRAWIRSIEGQGEITYRETFRPTNGKMLFAGAKRGGGAYELTTLVIEPDAAPDQKDNGAVIELRFGTEEDKGVAEIDDVELYRASVIGRDLVVDGRFQSGKLDHWNPGSSEASLEPGCGRTGNVCLQLRKKGSMKQVLSGLTPNTTYCASAWLKGKWFRFGARAGYKTDHISVNSAEAWVRRTIGFTTAPGSTQGEVYFFNPRDHDIWVDSVEVHEVAGLPKVVPRG